MRPIGSTPGTTQFTRTPVRATSLATDFVNAITPALDAEYADMSGLPSLPAIEAMWEAAAGLGAVIFIHPWGCSLGPRLSTSYLGNTFGQPAETALALSRLIFDGTLDRHPALKLLAAHGGSFLPTYTGRSDHAWENRPDARGCAGRPSEYLREIWYDALVYTPQALRHLVDAVGAGQVVLGTDHPFDMGVTDPVARAEAAGLPAADLTAILSGNAATLFGLDPCHAPRSN
jgi:predicted TIM-barrel fold metal-dependent hydrolase